MSDIVMKIDWLSFLCSQAYKFLSPCTYPKVILMGAVGLTSSLSLAEPVSPLVAQDAEREQAERLQQLEQSQRALEVLTPLPNLAPGATAPSDRCFTIDNVTFAGNQQFDNETLLSLIEFQPPACIGINEINEYLRLITNVYIEAGFVTSRAFLVPQDMSGGELTIEILGRVDLSSPSLLEAIFCSGKAVNKNNSHLYFLFTNAVRAKNSPSPSG